MDRFLRWCRGLLGMAAMWGAGSAIVGGVLLWALTVSTGIGPGVSWTQVAGLFGSLGLVCGSLFGVALSLPRGDGDLAFRPVYAGAVGFVAGVLGMFLGVLLVASGEFTLLGLFREMLPLLGVAGGVGGVSGAGLVLMARNAGDSSPLESGTAPLLSEDSALDEIG